MVNYFRKFNFLQCEFISDISFLIQRISNTKNKAPRDNRSTFFSPVNHSRFIDIIIPTYNRSSTVIIFLVNLLVKQIKPEDSITIVWQNHEKPPGFDYSRVNIIHLNRPNLPAARNIGLHSGKNDIVLYLDDDIIPQKGLLDAHRKCYDNPQTGAVAGFIHDPLFRASDKPSSFDYRTCQLIQNFSCKISQKTISFMGANMSFKRTALENIGGFNTNFIHNALWEEIDCAFRLLNAGFNILFCADAKVNHLQLPDGGCRTDKDSKYIFHLFANTTFFSCTYIPLIYFRDWFRFWKNRLEFLSRKNNKTGKKTSISYRYNYIIAGFLGILTGFLRFFLHGKKQKLPLDVIKNSGNKI
ncbi:MAG TPA: glycosyltransferase [Chitinispirillaceae bacterium]|nr:glycosyltransferase [Chitinispirillaceae bacterium]